MGRKLTETTKSRKMSMESEILLTFFVFFVNESDSGILHAPLVSKQHRIESEPIKAGEGDGLL